MHNESMGETVWRRLLTGVIALVVVLSAPVATVAAIDPFEPNDDYDEARTVGPGVYTAETDGALDDDVYAVFVEDGEEVVVELTFDATDADLDLSLDDPNRVEVDFSAGVTDVEVVSTVASETGLYYVWVVPFDAFGVVPYTLDISVSSSPGPGPNDPFEPNDNEDEAEPLGPGSYEAVISDGTDFDVFAVGLDAGERLVVDLTFQRLDGEVDVFVEGPQIEDFDTEFVDGGRATASVVAPYAGTYLVWVEPFDDASAPFVGPAPYALDVAVESNPVAPPDDGFEPNGVLAEAAAVDAGAVQATTHDEDDIDLFAIELQAGDELDVTLSFDGALANLDVYVYGPDGSLLDEALFDVGDSETVAVAAAQTGTHYVLVEPWEVDAPADYDLTLETGDGPLVPPVGGEPNDDFETATDLVLTGTDDVGTAVVDAEAGSDDPDYYSVVLDEGDELTADVFFQRTDELDGNTSLEVFDADRTLVASGTHTADGTTASWVATTPGVHYVLFEHVTDETVPYTLDVFVAFADGSDGPDDPDGPDDSDDPDGPNDDFETATHIDVGVPVTTVLGEGDVDVFAGELVAGTTVAGVFTPDFTDGMVDIGIYGPNQQLIDSRLVEAGEPVELVVSVPRTGTYYATVTSVGDAVGSYTVLVSETPSGPLDGPDE